MKNNDNTYTSILKIYQELRELAVKTNTVIVSATQTNIDAEYDAMALNIKKHNEKY